MDICSAIALLATVAGAGTQAAATSQAQENAAKASQAELERQQDYRKQATATFASSLSESAPARAQQQMAEGTTERQADYAKARSVPLTEGRLPYAAGEGGSRLLSDAGGRSQDHLSDAVRARLSGYTNWDLKQAIKDMRASSALNTIGNFSQGSQNVLPLELQGAAHSADGLASIGQGLSLLGTVGGAWNAAAAVPSSAANAASVAQTSRTLGTLGASSPGLWGTAAQGLPSQPYYNFFTGR